MRLSALCLATLASLAVAVGAASAPGPGDPRSMVLQRADAPAGFTQTGGRYVSNAQANRESQVKKDYAKLGRLRGYEATFEKNAVRGIIHVVSTASTYRTAAGARESLAITTRFVEASRSPRFRRLTLGRLGNEARLYKTTVTEGQTKVDVYSLVWRSGTVLSAVFGSALSGTGAPGPVVALARKQQARVATG